MAAIRPSGGRATVLGAQSVMDWHGTTLVIVLGEPGTANVPSGNIGAIIYSPNVALRIRHNASASTALTGPESGRLRADTEYAFNLNPGVTYISLTALSAATAEINWIKGAGD